MSTELAAAHAGTSTSAAAARAGGPLRSLWSTGWLAAILITVGAAVLRLIHLGSVQVDPFYDGAVRSMSLSWHNFFFGAVEPSASVSLDKPPVDLWLQVASVKLLGFSSVTLKLPQALAGTAAVPLLFEAVRRVFGARAGIAAALALAVLPIEVITSRSDTMDSVMMALLVLAFLCVVLAVQRGRIGWLIGAAVALGLAFNVKLDESVIALPGLLLIAYLGLPWSRKRRIATLALAGVVYVVVSLSWLSATLLFPAHDRPYAIGSTNGSAWNAAFVYNGTDRLAKKAMGGESGAVGNESAFPHRTQAQRDRIPITAPSPTRLLVRIGPLSGARLGIEILAGLLFGLPMLFFTRLRRRTGPDASDHDPAPRVRHAVTAGLMLWLLTGVVLFSHIARLHPRYTESFTPAVAATFGIGVGWVTSGNSPARRLLLAAGLGVVVLYAWHLLFGATPIWWVVTAAALAATALSFLTRAPSGLALAATLIALLTIPLWASVRSVDENISDANLLGALSPGELGPLSAYLRSHQGTARYEVAYDSATKFGALVVKDARPVLPLTTMEGRSFTSVERLKALIAAGAVRYAFLGGHCTEHTPRWNAACSAQATWIRAHATDVSEAAGLARKGILWRLPGGTA